METREIIELYEGYKEMLEEHHSEVMLLIRNVSGMEGISTDVEIREYVTELMNRAISLSNSIDSVNHKIKRLLKEVEKAY